MVTGSGTRYKKEILPDILGTPMKLFFDETQLAHQPRQYMVHGRIVEPFENPNRATTLISALQSAGLGLPTLIVQEGGYSLKAIEEASHAFMRAFRATHAVKA